MQTQAVPSTSEAAGTQLTRRVTELKTLLAVTRELVRSDLESSPDLLDSLDAALSNLARRLPQVELAWLLLHEPTSDSLRVAASVGYDPELMRQLALRPGESISGQVFRDGQPRLLETRQAIAAATQNMSRHNREIFAKVTRGRVPHSALAVPLVVGGRHLGVLVLEALDKPEGFTADDQPLLQAVADVMALAVERAEFQDEAENLRVTGKASQLRADILSAISHELRTPLASIKGYSTALLLDEVEWDETSRREFLTLIDEECDKLESIVHDFLDAARIEAGRLEIEFQPVMLPRLAQAEADSVSRHTPVHRFVLDFPSDFPVLDADPVRIGQVIRNLLDNAVKYSPQGGLIVMRGTVKEDEVVVSVSDQGMGIAPEDLNKLFERFFRVKTGAGYHIAGSGLGLPISQSIVEAHGGRIWAESQMGQGTTLYFTLPRAGLSASLGEETE